MTERTPHGFNKKEDWADFYESCHVLIARLSQDSIPVPQEGTALKEWVELYKKRSGIARQTYWEIENMLDMHIRYFIKDPSRWTAETADSLLAYLYRNCILITDDIETTLVTAESMIRYYEGIKDEAALMKCGLIKIAGYAKLDVVYWCDEIIRLCVDSSELFIKHYDALTEEERSMAVSIYDFELDQRTEIASGQENFPEEFEKHYLYRYHQGMKMVDRVIKDVDLSIEPNDSLPIIKVLFRSRLASLAVRRPEEEFTKKQRNYLYQTAQNLYEEECRQPSEDIGSRVMSRIAYLMAQRLKGEADDSRILELILEQMHSFPDIYRGEQFDSILLDASMYCLLALKQLTVLKNKNQEYFREMLRLVIRRISLFQHNNYNEYVVGGTIYRYICPTLKFLESREEIIRSLLGIMVCRQIQTALHVVMVGRIATLITESIIEECPRLLIGQLETRTWEEVKDNKDRFIQYVMIGALLHDVGKLFCSSVINMQYRKITDIEFETIKNHPESGGKVLSMIPQLAEFSDMAAGHHKSFDGKRGYPESFDNTKSSQKIFIDLITICDSLDAATDMLGRNYATAKDFRTVLQELVQGAGTFYSDVLVGHLLKCGSLQDKLSSLIEKERGQVYYDVYEIMQKIF